MIHMREKLHFQKRQLEPDPWGGDPRPGDFATVFTEPARLKPGLGSETIIASRLAGIQPYTVTVRSSTRTRGVSTAWRVVDARGPQPPNEKARVFAIKSIVNPDEKGRYIDLVVVEGEIE